MTKYLSMVGGALLAWALVSCASKPAAVEQPAPAAAPAAAPAVQPEPQPAPTPAPVPAPDKEIAEAKNLRERVVRYGLDTQAAADFAAAEAKLKEAEAQTGKDNSVAKAAADAAVTGYRKILQEGLPPLGRSSRQAADTVRGNATALKAPVALPNEYAAAEAVYQKAAAAEASGDWETAIDGYRQARELFARVYEQTREKKDQAERALAEARKGLSDAEARAKAAEEAQKAEGIR